MFEDQWRIAQGFEQKSSAGFDKIIMALGGMLIWTTQPTKRERQLKIGERSFSSITEH